MTDSHVHIGWFVDRYHSPVDVTVALRNVGVDSILVSSTSTCAEEYELVINEMSWLVEEWGDKLIPALWVTPKMIECNALDYMIASGIQWGAIKMHWQAHPDFFYNEQLTESILNDCRLSRLPILMHTGMSPECEAKVFKSVISNHSERTFILAHGRPVDDTIEILCSHSNAYVDTAFMPIPDILKLVSLGLEDRVLWGSDCPINEHFVPDIATESYLRQRIAELKNNLPDVIVNKITVENFKTAFLNIISNNKPINQQHTIA